MTSQQGIYSKVPQQYSLHNSDNYFQSLTHSPNEILNKYRLLVVEYLLFINETINNCKTNDNFKFIIFRGLTTITHVFIFTLHRSKNLNMTYFHSQKAFYYYTEFIGQIISDQNVFLQLTSRDATMFVYKKTIFEIHNDYKKSNAFMGEFTNENEKIDYLESYIQMIKNMVIYSTRLVDFKNMKLNELEYKITIVDKINHTCEFINKDKIQLNLFLDIKYLIEFLTDNNISENYYDIIHKYVNKVLIKNGDKNKENKREIIIEKIQNYFLLNNKIDDVDSFISKII